MEHYDKNALIVDLNKLAARLGQSDVTPEQVLAIWKKIAEANDIASHLSTMECNQKEEYVHTASENLKKENTPIFDIPPVADTTESSTSSTASESNFSSELLAYVNNIRSGKIAPAPISWRTE